MRSSLFRSKSNDEDANDLMAFVGFYSGFDSKTHDTMKNQEMALTIDKIISVA